MRWKREREGEKRLNNQLVDSVQQIREDFKLLQKKNRDLHEEKSKMTQNVVAISRELRDEQDLTDHLRNEILAIKSAKHTGGIENMKLQQDIEHMKRVNRNLRTEKDKA